MDAFQPHSNFESILCRLKIVSPVKLSAGPSGMSYRELSGLVGRNVDGAQCYLGRDRWERKSREIQRRICENMGVGNTVGEHVAGKAV